MSESLEKKLTEATLNAIDQFDEKYHAPRTKGLADKVLNFLACDRETMYLEGREYAAFQVRTR